MNLNSSSSIFMPCGRTFSNGSPSICPVRSYTNLDMSWLLNRLWLQSILYSEPSFSMKFSKQMDGWNVLNLLVVKSDTVVWLSVSHFCSIFCGGLLNVSTVFKSITALGQVRSSWNECFFVSHGREYENTKVSFYQWDFQSIVRRGCKYERFVFWQIVPGSKWICQFSESCAINCRKYENTNVSFFQVGILTNNSKYESFVFLVRFDFVV